MADSWRSTRRQLILLAARHREVYSSAILVSEPPTARRARMQSTSLRTGTLRTGPHGRTWPSAGTAVSLHFLRTRRISLPAYRTVLFHRALAVSQAG